MPTSKLSSAPSPRTFAEAIRRELLEPVATRVAGDDAKLDVDDQPAIDALHGADALAAPALRDRKVLTGSPSPSLSAFVDAATLRAEQAASAAAGPDGRLSAADAEQLPQDLRLAFHFLRTGEAPADAPVSPPPSSLTVPSRDGVTFSSRVFEEVAAAYQLTDGEQLLNKALELGDGNRYVNRHELEAAAQALRSAPGPSPDSPPVTDPPMTDAPASFAFSERVLEKVMAEFGILDRGGLLEVATRHDVDGNRYLKRSELEAAARELSGQGPGHQGVELGIISDIDKTLLPPHQDGDPLPPAYPGVSTLIGILEFGAAGDKRPGDTTYVTARSADRVAEMPSWMAREQLPTGAIATGISGVPWVAQAEKVKDISEVFDANPDQTYILFGDSSHRDPEVYKEILAKYPGRVLAAFIHKVNNPSAQRVEGLHLVTNYAEAAAILYGRGVLSEAAARTVMVKAQAEGLTLTDQAMDMLMDQHAPSPL